MITLGSKPGLRFQAHFQAGSLQRISLFASKDFCFDDSFCPTDQVEVFTGWLKAYGMGKEHLFPLVQLPKTFQGDVLRFLQTIPRGSVCSYKDVAKGIGRPRAARVVGNICRGNPYPLIIPCHRVIRSDGKIGRYTPDPSLKKELLHFEEAALSNVTGSS